MAEGGTGNPWTSAQQPRGTGGSAPNSRRRAYRRGRQASKKSTSDAVAQVSATKLRDTLRQAEADQAAKWMRKQHKAINNDLTLTATRLERASSLRDDSETLPFWHTTAARPAANVARNQDELARTWPSTGALGLRVDGRRVSLPATATLPPKPQKGGGASTRDTSHDKGGVAEEINATTSIFVERTRAAMKSRDVDEHTLKEFLLPSSVMDPQDNCTTVRSWELFKVLTLDLSMHLSESDKQFLSVRFGDGEDGGSIDVHALLAAVCPGSAMGNNAKISTTSATPSEEKTSINTREISQTATPHHDRASYRQVQPPAPHPQESDDIPQEPLVMHPVGLEGSPPAYEDVVNQQSETVHGELGAGPAMVPGRAQATAEMTTDVKMADEDDAKLNHSNGIGGSEPRGVQPGGEDINPLAKNAASSVEEENARLRSELETFDLEFFEEVEDLKYSYTALKLEAEKLARKQGVELSNLLDLPENGEEPWDRAVDMAHHSVDWPLAMKARALQENPTSPSRGTLSTRLAKRWGNNSATTVNEEEGFPLGSSPWRNGEVSPGEKLTPKVYSPSGSIKGMKEASTVHSTPANGLVAAHERKLAWELSTGGMDSLGRLREHVGRVDCAGGGFGSDEEILSALRRSGYAGLEVEDVAVLRTGLGSNNDGKMDVKEFMGMCEDMASDQEWYVPHASASAAAAVVANFVPPKAAESPKFPEYEGAEYMSSGPLPATILGHGGGEHERGVHEEEGGWRIGSLPFQPRHEDEVSGRVSGAEKLPSGFGNHDRHAEPLYLGGTVYGETRFLQPAKNAADVVVELKEQLSLLDVSRLFPSPEPAITPGGGGGRALTLGQVVGTKFSRRDPQQSGLLTAREIGLALEDIGVLLQLDEVVTLAGKFKPPGAKQLLNQHQRGNKNDERWTKRGAYSADSNGSEASVGGLDGVAAEYAPLVRLIVDYLAEAGGVDPEVGARATARQIGMKWHERMPAPAKRLETALAGKGGMAGSGWIERLKGRFNDFDMDGDGYLGQKEFMRALHLALPREDGSDSKPSSRFIVGDILSRNEAAELMARLDRNRDGRICWKEFTDYFEGVEAARYGRDHPRDAWFQQEGEVAEKLLQHMELQGGSTERRAWVNRLRRRFQTADVHEVGALDRETFCRCLRGMRIPISTREENRLFSALQPTTTDTRGARYPEMINFLRSKNSKWYEVERDIAQKILSAMGSDSASRRAWLNRMRRRFMSLDSFRVGVLGGSDLLQALRDQGCYLRVDEEARLLDALETEESARFDSEGGVSYRELLLFCGRHAGKWSDSQPALAERMRDSLRSQAKTVADVRRLFRRLDDDGDGLIGVHDFEVGLHRLGLGFLTPDEKEMLMDELDAQGLGSVRYEDFATFFMDADPWFKTDADLAERLCKSLEISGINEDGTRGSAGPGSVLGKMRERFVAADRNKTGSIDGRQFRSILESLPGTHGLTDDEVDRLATSLDEEGNGRVSYRSLLRLLAGHLGDWTKQLPEVASQLALSLQATQYGLKACVENLARRMRIADHAGTGRLSPSVLGRCLRSVGLALSPAHLTEMVTVMDAHGDGLIPIPPLLEFLRKEAGIAPPSSPRTERTTEQVGGKLGEAFRRAVLSLAKAERENFVTRGDMNCDGHGGDSGETLENRTASSSYRRPTNSLSWAWRSRPAGGVDGKVVRENKPWRTCLRRVFDRRLDLDGDGYLTEGDLVVCLPEIGVEAHGRGEAKALLTAMDSKQRGLGQATFKDFAEFMGELSFEESFYAQIGGRGTSSPQHDRTADEAPTGLAPLRLAQEVRLALGLPAKPPTVAGKKSDDIIMGMNLRGEMAKLDPQGNGRLPLEKIKAALQGLGCAVGNVPRASWLELIGSLDQDANGHIFYDDFADLLLLRAVPLEPSLSSSYGNSSREGRTTADRDEHPRQEDKMRHTGGNTNRSIARTTAGTRASIDATKSWIGRSRSPQRSTGPFLSSAEKRKEDSSATLEVLARRVLDSILDEHGGIPEAGVALRSALRRQDLTRSGRLSHGEFRLALESAGVPLSAMEVNILFERFDRRGSGVLNYDRFASWILLRAEQGRDHIGSATSNVRGSSCPSPSPPPRRFSPIRKIASVVGPAVSLRRAINDRQSDVHSLRRRLKKMVFKEKKLTIGDLEFRRLLRSSGLNLTSVQVGYLRQKCGNRSGQVNVLALLAYLEPPASAGNREGTGPQKRL